jgi:hypothetical protein
MPQIFIDKHEYTGAFLDEPTIIEQTYNPQFIF